MSCEHKPIDLHWKSNGSMRNGFDIEFTGDDNKLAKMVEVFFCQKCKCLYFEEKK